jgi:hypothetical protein
MTLFSGMLFLHVAAALGIFTALGLESLQLFHLRRAGSAREAGVWVSLVPGLPAMFGASAAVMLLTGVYLAVQMSAWPQAWLKVTMAGLVLMVPFGAVSGRKMRAMRNVIAVAEPDEISLFRRLQDPVLKFSLGIRIALVLGIVLLMTAKPELRESMGVIAASLLLGFASALLFWRGAPSPAVRARSGE